MSEFFVSSDKLTQTNLQMYKVFLHGKNMLFVLELCQK